MPASAEPWRFLPGAADPPGIYLHVPFCSAICPYCDFAVTRGGADKRAAFVAALCGEIAAWGERRGGADWPFGDRPFDTIYLGGGTPSALAPEQLAAILAEIHADLPVVERPWTSLEVNPEDVDAEALEAWRLLGVDTVSLGVQSFDDTTLRFLGRRHDGATARRAVAAALAAGFPIVSVDLIFGLPGQSADAWRADLDAALALAPQHLSCYQLTIHEGTPFGLRERRGTLRALGDDGQAELFQLAHTHLSGGGLHGYEVSNFARSPATRSRHNRKYWRHTPYLGLGPSAHSYARGERWWNERQLGTWGAAVAAGASPVAGRERLTAADLALEHLMLGLRTAAGVDLAALAALGFPLTGDHPRALAAMVDDGLVVERAGHLVPTLAGWAVADGLARALAPAAGAGE